MVFVSFFPYSLSLFSTMQQMPRIRSPGPWEHLDPGDPLKTVCTTIFNINDLKMEKYRKNIPVLTMESDTPD
jgi:hypothetical protein